MSDRTDEPRDIPAGTHCEWCGAALDEQQADRPRPATPKPAVAPADVGETHCEWCGAEYPVPGGEPAG